MTWRRWLDDLARDVRHAVRGLRRSPGLSATVVIVLALGIGANTAMFSIVYGMLPRPLPHPGGERIVRLGREPRGMPGGPVFLSAREVPPSASAGRMTRPTAATIRSQRVASRTSCRRPERVRA